MNRDILKLLTTIKQAAMYPDRFSDEERTAMVDTVMVYLNSSDNWVAIRAAEVAVAMVAANIKAKRLAGTASGSEPWATYGLPAR